MPEWQKAQEAGRFIKMALMWLENIEDESARATARNSLLIALAYLGCEPFTTVNGTSAQWLHVQTP